MHLRGSHHVWVFVAAAVLLLPTAARADRWVAGAQMTEKRSAAASVTLEDGRVLSIGGLTGKPPTVVRTVDRYDPVTGMWGNAAPMGADRAYPIAVRLPDGRVLVAGGVAQDGQSLTSAEVYNPATDSWTPTDNALSVARNDGGPSDVATLLSNGRVLLTGAATTSTSVDLYDPPTNKFAAAGPLNHARVGATLVGLPGGKALVVGGSAPGTLVTTAEVYDPGADTWTASGTLTAGRLGPIMFALPTGKVLVAGGIGVVNGSAAALTSAELYDPAAKEFAATGSMQVAHFYGAAGQLADGQVVVASGTSGINEADAPSSAVDVYNPETGAWTQGAVMPSPVNNPAAVGIVGGRLMVAGGTDPANPLDATRFFVPNTLPSAPQAVAATAGSGQATVTWTAPADDGGNAITTYTVTASSGRTATAAGAETSAVVTGLVNGTPVTFTVTATTAFGTSPASAPSAAVTPQDASVTPTPSATPAPASDKLAPKITVKGLRRALKRKAVLRGVKFTVTTDEKAKLAVTLLRGGRSLASKRFGLGTSRRVRLKPRKLPKGKLTVRIKATDAAGNASVVERKLAIKGTKT